MVSSIGDGWKDNFPQKWPHFNPLPQDLSGVSRIEFEALRQEIIELKKLLQAAKAFDEKTGQPHCEIDEKVRLIKAIAKIVGVDLGDVFGTPNKPKKAKP